MPRPKRKRVMQVPPAVEGFRPFGVPRSNIEPIELLFEEYEAIRLADYKGLTQEEAAKEMRISRPTFTRIYEKARKTIAEAFVEGKAIIVNGGDFHTKDHWYRCKDCNEVTVSKEETERCRHCHSKNLNSLTRCSKEGFSKGGVCICVNCDKEIAHEQGKPCREQICPKCGANMMKKGSYHHLLYLKSKGHL